MSGRHCSVCGSALWGSVTGTWFHLADGTAACTPALDDDVRFLVGMFSRDAVSQAVARVLALPSAVTSVPARATDPATARAAGDRHATSDVGRFSRASTSGRLLVAFARNALAGAEGLTDQEATRMLLADEVRVARFEGVRRRCSDLRRAGFISATGLTRCNDGSPDESDVCRITDAGMVAWEHLLADGWSR